MGKQDGAALIVVLAVLVVTLMLGLSSMQSSLVDERLAGNYRAQVEAQMSAESGVVEAWEDFKTNWATVHATQSVQEILEYADYTPSGGFPFSSMVEDSYSIMSSSSDEYGVNGTSCSEAGVAYCFYSLISIPEHDESETGYPTVSGLYAWSVGSSNSDWKTMSVPILTRINVGFYSFRNLMPLTISSGLYDFKAPSGGQFAMSREGDGNTGAAIAVSQFSEVQAVLDAVKDSREGNYVANDDGDFVIEKNDFDIFSNPVDLQEFVGRIVELCQSDSENQYCDDGFGTPSDPKITYINPESGEYKYNEQADKGGIMIVDGDFTWAGNNTYEGLIVVLGQTFTYNGGGNGSMRGALVHAAIDGSTRCEGCTWQFGVGSTEEGAEALLNGGGDSAFVHSNEVLDNVASMMPFSVVDGLVSKNNFIKLAQPSLGDWSS